MLLELTRVVQELFRGRTVLELGCGIGAHDMERVSGSCWNTLTDTVYERYVGVWSPGFASVVVSRFADVVFATDADVAALWLTKRNADRNACVSREALGVCGSHRVQLLAYMCTEV